jgi:hypothetical protein
VEELRNVLAALETRPQAAGRDGSEALVLSREIADMADEFAFLQERSRIDRDALLDEYDRRHPPNLNWPVVEEDLGPTDSALLPDLL